MNLPVRPVFPVPRNAIDLVVTYVADPGQGNGEPPVLHVTFTEGGRRKMMLIDSIRLTERGLPTDYETLSAAFPELRWSKR